MQSSKNPLPQSFLAKKKSILDQLAVPISEYDDLSPKGSIDVGIRDLIDEINQIEGCVTTSSCSGRVSVFLEGKKQANTESSDDQLNDENGDGQVKTKQLEAQAFAGESGARETTAKVGGKGGGGRWLYVSHSEVDISQHEYPGGLVKLLGMDDLQDGLSHGVGRRFIHFKFEPMVSDKLLIYNLKWMKPLTDDLQILHVLTASFEQAQIVLSAALQAGFRESGAINLTSSSKDPPTPIVAVRSMGLALESLIGFHADEKEMCSVSEGTLRTLLEISNDRFQVNTARITRFRDLLTESMTTDSRPKRREDGEEWEDAEVRKERKKAEGLRRKEILRATKDAVVDPEDVASPEFFP